MLLSRFEGQLGLLHPTLEKHTEGRDESNNGDDTEQGCGFHEQHINRGVAKTAVTHLKVHVKN